MIESLPREAWIVWWAVLGLFVGSFLNVAIHRWPLEDETISKPRRSRCPSCKTSLTWKENIPLLSWLAQRGRCRTCGWRIPARYPLVEASNCALWAWIAVLSLPEQFPLAIVHSIALSGLLVATFVDFDRFEIPDEISIGGMVLAPVASLLVPSLHSGTWVAHWMEGDATLAVGRTSALIASVAGMVVGGGVLWLIGRLGTMVYGRDAMGFGDVKLLAAGGGLIGPGGALIALMLASLVASVAGLGNMARFFCLLRKRARTRGTHPPLVRQLAVARIAGRYLPFGPYLALGIGIVLLHWDDVRKLWPY
jgi:leader peptidase (prepilin peptidase) / N-methyltransferase